MSLTSTPKGAIDISYMLGQLSGAGPSERQRWHTPHRPDLVGGSDPDQRRVFYAEHFVRMRLFSEAKIF